MRLMYHFVEHTRACEICGKPYKVGGGRGLWNKGTGGPSCAREKSRLKNLARFRAHPGRHSIRVLGADRVCEVCGKAFTVPHPSAWNRWVCSTACREERLRRRHRAWFRAHPDYEREKYRRRKEARERGASPPPKDDLPPRFCLGCGGKTHQKAYPKRGLKRDKDLEHWHLSCYRRFLYRWTIGLFKGQGVKRACRICGRTFESRTHGGFTEKICSVECRKENKRRWSKAWRERNQKRIELWEAYNRDRLHAKRRARRPG